MSNAKPALFGRLTPGGRKNFADTLRAENTGAILLLAGAVVALLWANSPWREAYVSLGDIVLGPSALHLDLSVSQWATDGLLAIFFFVVGVELKREMVTGQLRRPSTAIVPILAAVGGMAVPALLYTLVNSVSSTGSLEGWAIPVATDIAFAVAVLTIFGKRLPTALRAFLLTLAVVDDLLGIVVIGAFYTESLAFAWLGASILAIAAFGFLVRRRGMTAWVLIPLGVLAWGFMHASGIHATIAGVLLGFTVPAIARHGASISLAERYEHLWRPVSAGLAVPVFALFAAGVTLSPDALASTAGDPTAQGVALGLVVGKPIGILLATFLLVKLTKARLDASVRWLDLTAVACVAGIGFTVSLLIGELSFPASSPHSEHVKAAVLIGSLLSAAIGGALLTWRTRVAARTEVAAQLPADADA
ncbi:Na+/H+ antiporter NhaA [Cellulomonas chengniuliangii]|uniref:Na(+)/H(+) antiporter NhaA n=1 Tax=Cellulomonas chengniuliangii TaxID=2968084 RepID=A0ABY5KZ08_9CELL|nr:Na+/H+ antiporter NhaA [Cellulomonas chengniuliangii]MCC2307474.1 Na+/H+ antiporter NhaA [Cellulomonas chengniuliangii]UUI75752.1 Na+/H+ antiporter NhaA [Cellulomonas chengniuliangii]